MAGALSIEHRYRAGSSDVQRMLVDLFDVFCGSGSITTFGCLVSAEVTSSLQFIILKVYLKCTANVYTRKNLTSCSKSANEFGTSC